MLVTTFMIYLLGFFMNVDNLIRNEGVQINVAPWNSATRLESTIYKWEKVHRFKDVVCMHVDSLIAKTGLIQYITFFWVLSTCKKKKKYGKFLSLKSSRFGINESTMKLFSSFLYIYCQSAFKMHSLIVNKAYIDFTPCSSVTSVIIKSLAALCIPI